MACARARLLRLRASQLEPKKSAVLALLESSEIARKLTLFLSETKGGTEAEDQRVLSDTLVLQGLFFETY